MSRQVVVSAQMTIPVAACALSAASRVTAFARHRAASVPRPMSKPAVLVVDDDRERLDTVDAALGRRQGEDSSSSARAQSSASGRVTLRIAIRPVA
jgi:hypothetical protein